MHPKLTQNRRSQSCYHSTNSSNKIQLASRKRFIKVLSNKSSKKNSISTLSQPDIQNNEPIKEQLFNWLPQRHTFNHEKDKISNENSYHTRSASMPNKTQNLHKTIITPQNLSYLTPTSISINFSTCTSKQHIKKLDIPLFQNHNHCKKNQKYYSLVNQTSNNQYFDGKSSVNESTLEQLQINSLSLENNNAKNKAFGQIKHQKNLIKSFYSNNQKQNSQIQQKQKQDPKTVTQQKEIKLKIKHILLPKRAPIPQ